MQFADNHDVYPGISAILAVQPGQADLEPLVLDLGAVLDALVASNFEILIVEHGGRQPTPHLLEELAARRPQLSLRVLPGLSTDRFSALDKGFAASQYDLLFVTAADGQFEVSELNRLLEAIEHGADLAIGYRPARADGLVKRLDGWLLNAAMSVVFGHTARDLQCEFKLFRRLVWERLRPLPRGLTFNSEFLAGARRLGFVINEVAVSHHPARGRHSTIGQADPSVVAANRRAA